jgi:hypothetical protein
VRCSVDWRFQTVMLMVWPLLCEGFLAIVGCAGYREIPLMLGAAGVGGVGCGRFGAAVVLHARCTPKITHHLGSQGGHNVSAGHDHVQTGGPGSVPPPSRQ